MMMSSRAVIGRVRVILSAASKCTFLWCATFIAVAGLSGAGLAGTTNTRRIQNF